MPSESIGAFSTESASFVQVMRHRVAEDGVYRVSVKGGGSGELRIEARGAPADPTASVALRAGDFVEVFFRSLNNKAASFDKLELTLDPV